MREYPILPLVLLGSLLCAVVGCSTPASPRPTPAQVATLPPVSGPDWTTYHRDLARSGSVSDTPDPTQLIRAWSTPLDGAVYAEPLVIGGLLVAATEANSLYGLDVRTGQVRWQTTIGPPVQRADLPCGNISPLGITGTPVYDSATQLVFAVAELSGPNHTVSHQLVGVDLPTGQVRLRRSADPPGMDPRPHQQRAALALAGGWVYIAYGGLFGDCGNYRGRVLAARTDGQGELLSFQVPTPREGGIWAPPGPSIDPAGRLYVAVGNGEATGGAWDHSDSILRLSPRLQLEDGFAPTSWAQDNAADADLGSMGPVLLPDGWIVAAGKSGEGYLLRADHLGGVGGQVQARPLCRAFGGAATLGARAFLPCTDGVREVRVENGQLVLGWHAPAQVSGSPVVGGQTVYSLDTQGEGVLYALDRERGTMRTSLAVGAVSRFATPTLVGRALFVGTLTGVVAIQIA
jgi:outer membrane protein assembly factor BamB